MNIEAKASLKSNTMVWNLDIRCPKGHRPFYNTFSKVQTQSSNNKDSFYFEKSKPKDPKLALPRNNAAAKPAKKKNRKDKKKRFQKQKWEYTGKQKE